MTIFRSLPKIFCRNLSTFIGVSYQTFGKNAAKWQKSKIPYCFLSRGGTCLVRSKLFLTKIGLK